MMKKKSKILIVIASLLLLLTFLFPLWRIDLQAPQYPEGLGLNIWVNQITGLNENDVDRINGLNHYIGMKEITPDDIPELQYMPYIIVFMVLFGLTIAFTGKRKLLYVWLGLFVVLAIIGLYDFHMWGYDYGHNLNPDAPIKVPGMTYQPPLFGSKQLLNINAVSLPYIGSIVILISILISIFTLFLDRTKTVKAKV
jgi:copper chaperone NosL